MMKKILLGTSAIVGASVLLATPLWAAEKPKLSIDGWLRFEAWMNDEDDNVLGSASDDYNRGVQFDMDDVEIHFLGSSKADNGLEYGFYVELIEGTGTSSTQFDEANVFFSGGWGKLELGSNDGIENNYKPGGYSVIADKDGAWDGKAGFNKYGSSAFIGTDLGARVAGADSTTGDATKITYYTPSFSGFSAGVSYTPDSGDEFNHGINDDTTTTNLSNAVSAAVQYKGTFSDVSVQVAARYLASDFEANDRGAGNTTDLEDMRAWGIGGVVSFAGFSLGASYQDLGDSGVTKANADAGADAGKWYDVGIGYATGPYKVSVAYMHSEAANTSGTQDDEVDYYAIGANYAAAPGLDLYATYQFIDLDQTGTLSDNEANMFMVGTQISF